MTDLDSKNRRLSDLLGGVESIRLLGREELELWKPKKKYVILLASPLDVFATVNDGMRGVIPRAPTRSSTACVSDTSKATWPMPPPRGSASSARRASYVANGKSVKRTAPMCR